ncbi:DUF4465 domain-containing protein [Rhodopirellula europaea]|jgi:hypothetical protein|uniref:Lipoprotein n=1 Tax=Rhodopirellula europaea SH398 TaxID=1263868 RepID=M5S583_9BACT|nr:DUF4465 domain-containing protein [Rhodopirellula europaea]EMI26680.1 lipoprotein [Rhodopirellula europaea SH398]MCR9210714.1 DUF4465 domain-containing protein [bacterium]
MFPLPSILRLLSRNLIKAPQSKCNTHDRFLVAFTLLSLSHLAASPAQADVVVGFENQDLGSSGVYNGPVPNADVVPGSYGGNDHIGVFSADGVDFSNSRNDLYGSWSGFAVSNHTDTSTPGYSNQFSAYADSGSGGSDNYAVAFGYTNSTPTNIDTLTALPSIYLPDGEQASSADITNATYAGLSMRDGDSFAKQFGGVTGSDPDFFKLSVFGIDANNQILDTTIDVFLADFRFTDSLQDYILDDWVTIDLSSMSDARSLHFNLSSSDVGPYGMNTPGYFALDNFATVTAVPEPSSLAIIGSVLLGTVIRRRRRLKRLQDSTVTALE